MKIGFRCPDRRRAMSPRSILGYLLPLVVDAARLRQCILDLYFPAADFTHFARCRASVRMDVPQPARFSRRRFRMLMGTRCRRQMYSEPLESGSQHDTLLPWRLERRRHMPQNSARPCRPALLRAMQPTFIGVAILTYD